ncbi:MAG: hypothetical protein C4323_03815, partial [Mastigocladus sp. ERB_26_2]
VVFEIDKKAPSISEGAFVLNAEGRRVNAKERGVFVDLCASVCICVRFQSTYQITGSYFHLTQC